MDEHTQTKLEFDRIRELLASHASCALGRQLAQRIAPSRRAAQVRLWLTQTAEFRQWVHVHGDPPLGGVRDVRSMVRRAVPPTKLEPGEFAELASTLEGIGAVRRYLSPSGDAPDSVTRLAARVGDFQLISERIHRVIDERGEVRDTASDRLWRIRQEIDNVRQQTREVFDKLLRQPAITRYLQYPNATFHADRMVLPLKADQRGRISGIVHRSSDSGQTLFVEPAEAVEHNNKRIRLLQDESEEIGRILWELTHLVHLNQGELLGTLETISVIDLLAAKVRLARTYHMELAEINDDHKVLLRQARHPILLMLSAAASREGAPPHPVIPIDVRLGDDFDVMVITGPNTGGKTAALKTVGLLALMTQAGLPIPAEAGSTLPVFDGIWIDVGDEQSLQQSLSTFSAHLRRILDILQKARRNTLVLLDELGAGTDPDEGAAIGRAIIEHLLSSGCLAMVTTHLGALKSMALETKRVDNAAVQFDLETLRPLFELRIGEPGNSNAIDIAARLGMPRKIVSAARRHLTGQFRALNRAIGSTLKSRREAERARRDAEMARQEAARATLAAMDRAKALEEQLKQYTTWVEKVMSLQPGDPVHVRKFDRAGRVVRVKLEKQQVSVDLGTIEVDVPLADVAFEPACPE